MKTPYLQVLCNLWINDLFFTLTSMALDTTLNDEKSIGFVGWIRAAGPPSTDSHSQLKTLSCAFGGK